MKTLEDFFSGLEVTESRNDGAFQVFGLKHPMNDKLRYLTLDEALDRGLVEITEITEGGQVPTLKVSNLGEQMLFLMAGEQLQGAKQNRVLNVSIMVPAKSDMPIPVSCVEAGRWAYSTRLFGSSRTTSHSKLRAQMSMDMLHSYRATKTPQSDQSGVWSEISRKLGKMGSRSPSSALNQVFEDYDAKLRNVTESIPCPAECSGAVFAFHGQIVGMDLFDKPGTFEKLWPKLVRGYAIDALEDSNDSRQLGLKEVEAWLKSALSSKREKFESPGLGVDVRFVGDDVVGSSLVLEEEPVHTELFQNRTRSH